MRKVLIAVAALVVAAVAAASASASVTPAFSATDVATCNGTSTVTVGITAQNPPPEQQAADIVLLVDDSGSIGSGPFNTQVRPALNSFITAAAPSATGNHIGIIEFGTGTNNVTGGLLSNATTLTSFVNTMPYRAGFTHTLTGLQAADTMLSGASARAGVPQVIIVVTDGVWNPATENPTAFANTLANTDGVAIWAVGVGSGVNAAQLTAITGGHGDRVFSIGDFDELEAALADALLEVVPAATNITYTATAAPDWTITGSSAGTVAANTITWSVPEINSPAGTTLTLTYTQQHTGVTNGVKPLSSAATLTYTDQTGTHVVDYSTQTVTVSGCNRPPVANAGADQSVLIGGSGTASVTLNGTGSSDPDGDALTYTWKEGATTLATGATPTVALPFGLHTLTLTVSDGQYSDSDTVVIDVGVDTAGLCALIEASSDNAGVAHSLCVKLQHGSMRAFFNELAAQRGKHIPAAAADLIRTLAGEL